MKQEDLMACKGCPDRRLHCHDTCEKYKAIQAHFEKIREVKSKENDYYDYAVKIVVRNKGLGERRF